MYAFLNLHDDVSLGLRFSASNFMEEECIHSYPLYAVASILMNREYLDGLA